MSVTPKREKRPPKRYADSPILLANKKKKEQKSPGSPAAATISSDPDPSATILHSIPSVTTGASPVKVQTPTPTKSKAPGTSSPKASNSLSPKSSLAITTAALAARLNTPSAVTPKALESLPSIVPPYIDSTNTSGTSSPVPIDSQETPPAKVCPVFKDPNFIHSTKGQTGNKLRAWRNLKQILASERSMKWKPDDAYYACLDAPPSFIPAKKYSDITGLPAKYTDPHTKLRYASTVEFKRIKCLTADIVTGYLTLRKYNIAV